MTAELTAELTAEMPTGRIQDFAASVLARGQVTFGDVRRLQRDYLPDGITTREDAEMLVALSDKLVRADRAWAQWLVAAIAHWLSSQDGFDASAEHAARASSDSLLAASPASTALGRRIARTIRRDLPKLLATAAEKPPQPQPVHADRCLAPRAHLIGAIARSDIIAPPGCARVARRKRRSAPAPILPVEVWSARMMEKHQRFQLERPCF